MKRKLIMCILLSALFAVSLVSATDISSCPYDITSSGTYDVVNNLSTAGVCLNVSANNVIIDLHGYTLNGTDNWLTDDGVWISDGFNYTTIKNGIVSNFGAGIFFRNYNYYSNVFNLTLISNTQYGIAIQNSYYINVTNISIIPEGDTDVGIWIGGGSNNILRNMIIESCDDSGITIDTSTNNILASMTINLSNYGIYIDTSSHNKFTDINISDSTTKDVWLQSNSINNTFLNVSYITELVSSRSPSQLIRKWHYQAKVQEPDTNPIQGASVKAKNITGILIDSSTTDVNGFTDLMELTEYVNTGGTKTYYSNYTITASKGGGYSSSSISRNITGNKFDDVFTLTFIPQTVIVRYEDETATIPQNHIERFDDGTIEINVPKNIFKRFYRWIIGLD